MVERLHRLATSDAVIAGLDLAPESERADCIVLMSEAPILADRPEIDDTVGSHIAHQLMPASLFRPYLSAIPV